MSVAKANPISKVCTQHGERMHLVPGPVSFADLGFGALTAAERIELAGVDAWACPSCDRQAKGQRSWSVGRDVRERCRRLAPPLSRLLGAEPDSNVSLQIAFGPLRVVAPAIPEVQRPAPMAHASEGPEGPSASGAEAAWEVRTSERGFDQLVLPEDVRASLRRVLATFQHQEFLRKCGRNALPVRLFHGPPGTGKTRAAEALAFEMGRPLLVARMDQIESKWRGESLKNLRSAFDAARATGALIFFDEADAVLGRRVADPSTGSDNTDNALRGVLLQELDRREVPVVFATNRPDVADTAFRRRIRESVAFALPNASARAQILDMLLTPAIPIACVAPAERAEMLVRLSEESEGLSGGDLDNVVEFALTEMLATRGPDSQVELADLLEGVRQARTAHETVGRDHRPSQRVQVSEVSMAEAEHALGQARGDDPFAVAPQSGAASLTAAD